MQAGGFVIELQVPQIAGGDLIRRAGRFAEIQFGHGIDIAVFKSKRLNHVSNQRADPARVPVGRYKTEPDISNYRTISVQEKFYHSG